MTEKFDSLPDSENLRVIYNSRLAYINTVVTYRFTTLGFFLAGVGLILGGGLSRNLFILLTLITLSLYAVELRNRFLKNRLEVEQKQIEKKWGYFQDGTDDIKPERTTIFGFRLPYKKDDYIKLRITHSTALDVLYLSILFYALYNSVFWKLTTP